MTTTTTTTTDSTVDAFLEAPFLASYQKYADYLHDFNLFLDFLVRHPNVASAQTKRRVKQPSVASVESMQRKLRPLMKPKDSLKDWVVDSSGDDEPTPRRGSTDHVVADKPAGSVAPKDPLPFVDFGLRPAVKTSFVPSNPLAGKPSATLMGKKQCKKALLPYCSLTLADRLVSTDYISRDPDVFPRMVKHLAARAAHAGRKLGNEDVKIRLLDEPPVNPGLVDYVDYKALFEGSPPCSSEESS